MRVILNLIGCLYQTNTNSTKEVQPATTSDGPMTTEDLVLYKPPNTISMFNKHPQIMEANILLPTYYKELYLIFILLLRCHMFLLRKENLLFALTLQSPKKERYLLMSE